MNQGYATLADLMTLTKDGVKDLVNYINRNVAGVNAPFRIIDGLLNFCYWAILTSCMGVTTMTKLNVILSNKSGWINRSGDWPTQKSLKSPSC